MSDWRKKDPWSYFWSQYLVWIVRFISYIANFFFLASVVAAIHFFVAVPIVVELVLLGYTGIAFFYAEKFASTKYRPRFYSEEEAKQKNITSKDAIILRADQYEYRTTAEKMMFASWTFAAFNIAIGSIVAVLIRYPADDLIMGVFGLFMATVFSFFAVIGLTAKDEKTGKQSIFAIMVGLVFNILPVLFIMYGLWRFFINVYLT